MPAKTKGKYFARRVVVDKLPGSRVFRQKPVSSHRKTITNPDVDDESNQETGNTISFQIRDTEMVKQYLKEKFGDLQQQACKKIAKAWIKGICPKKQAKFPYQRKKQTEEGEDSAEAPEPPPW